MSNYHSSTNEDEPIVRKSKGERKGKSINLVIEDNDSAEEDVTKENTDTTENITMEEENNERNCLNYTNRL